MKSSLAPLNVLIVINSLTSAVRSFTHTLLPWFDHYGIPYDVVDLLREPLPEDLPDFPLVVLGHAGLDDQGTRLGPDGLEQLRTAVEMGCGLVSFDPRLSCRLLGETGEVEEGQEVQALEVAGGHPITERYIIGQRIGLVSPLALSQVPDGEKLIVGAGGTRPLLSVQQHGLGRLVHWAAAAWMDSSVLGPLGGLDSAFWRSMVWAARKPFCMRGFPPVVTMRVDDVAGWGGLWQREPLYWVQDAVKAGFKPWLGLFIYNLEEQTIDDLRDFLLNGEATAFPHAFGRPPRDGAAGGIYYDPAALPLRSPSYDEFIYFNHIDQVPWSDVEAERGLDAVDAWYRANGPLPMSKCALAHWYEMGTNTARHVSEVWGCEFLGKVMDFDQPLIAGIPWLRQGPFRLHEEAGESLPHTSQPSGHRPVFYADYLQAGGARFFNSVTEIRDDAGYEWAPDNDVAASVGRGGRQLRRALDAMALASLFTHETDFIYKIEPGHWAEIINGVAEEISAYQPLQMTMDEAYGLLRATRSSRLRSCRLDTRSDELLVTIEGQADRSTYFYIFRDHDGKIEEELREVPAFEGFILNAYPLH